MKKAHLLIGILIGISTLVGVGYKLDHRWARPSMTDHEVLASSVRSMEMKNTQEQIWQIEDRYRGVEEYQWKPQDLDRYRRLQRYLKCLDEGKKDCQYHR